MHVKQLVAGVFVTGVVTAGIMAAPGDASPQSSSMQTINADSSRPLLEVVSALQKEYGVVINYEDPPYHRSEGIDVTEMRSQGKPLPTTREVIPRGGRFSFEYRLPPGLRGDGFARVLADLVRQFRAARYGQFRVDRNCDTFSIVPISRRVARGVDEPYEPLLDTQLHFVSTGNERSALEATQELVEALQAAAGVPVHLGTIPVNLLRTTGAPDLAGSMAARTALAQILGGTYVPVSWALLTMPTEPREWWLNIKSVR